MNDGAQPDLTRETPPGWGPDPRQRHELRYWNGTAWTEHVSDRGTAARDPLDAAGATAATPDVRTEPALVGSGNGVRTAPLPGWASGTRSEPAGDTRIAPRLPPPNPYQPPRAPGTVDLNVIGQPVGTLTRPWYRAAWVWVVVVAVIVLVAAPVSYFAARGGPERIDAAPASPAPAGWQPVTTDSYRIAVPAGWISRPLDGRTIKRVADQAADRAPDAADAMHATADAVSGPATLAVDPVTGDNVTVLRYSAMSGDPGDHVADFERSIRDAVPTITALTADPGDVHGFPSVTVTGSYTLLGVPLTGVSTLIQTGDHAFQVTVTSKSAARGRLLSAAVLATFAPR